MLVTLLCPGPNEPPQLISWLQPLINDLMVLSMQGIEAIDGSTPDKEQFVLKAHATMILADAIAARQVLRMKGHTSCRGCRMCRNEGIRHGSIFYYPHAGYDNLDAYDKDVYDEYLDQGGAEILGDYNFQDPPLRRHLRRDILDVVRANNERIRKETGISGFSAFFPVETIHFPRSIPHDTLHAILLNHVRDKIRILRGGLFNVDLIPDQAEELDHDDVQDADMDPGAANESENDEDENNGEEDIELNNEYHHGEYARAIHRAPLRARRAVQGYDGRDEFVLPANEWATIGEEMENSRSTVPGAFGRPPRNIDRLFNSFKAAEWSSFLLLYSLPVFEGRLPGRYLDNWKDLIRIWALVCKRSITKEELATVQLLCERYDACIPSFLHIYPNNCHNSYVKDYERLYFRGRRDRLKILKSNLHSLLHLADSLADLGPGYVWWCFSGERFNGMLEGKAKSKVRIDASLGNALWLDEVLIYAQMARRELDLSTVAQVHPNEGDYENAPIARHSHNTPHGVLKTRYRNVALTQGERIRLKEFLQMEQADQTIRIGEIPLHIHQYARFITKDKSTFGSVRSQSISTINRDSAWIMFKLIPDQDNQPAAVELDDHGERNLQNYYTFGYGEVAYYVALTVREQSHFLARVHGYTADRLLHNPLLCKFREGNVNIARYWKWVNIKDIISVIGRFKTERGTYIIHQPNKDMYHIGLEFEHQNLLNPHVDEHELNREPEVVGHDI